MDHKPPEKIEHILTLKVMRLTKPTLSSPLIVTNEIKDLPENLLNNDLKNDITSVEGSEELAVGQFLLTPQSFGNIYLGESFLSYIFVHNDSIHTAKNVTLKADLQFSNEKISLSDYSTSELTPEKTIDQVIHHEVKEIGTHILVCEVSYLSPNGEPLSFKKHFKFQVFKPLDVKTKFYVAEDFISDEVFLEAQVQNTTAGPINLEKVSLESSHLFKGRSVAEKSDDESPLLSPVPPIISFCQSTQRLSQSLRRQHETLFFLVSTRKFTTRMSSLNNTEEKKPGDGLLQPEYSRQFLYCLSPAYNPRGGNVLAATDIGRLDIAWRSALGEKGRLQTSQLQRMAPNFGDIRLSVHNLPNIVKIEEPFTFTCKIANLSKTSMDLVLGLEKLYPDLLWIGTSGRHLGRLEIGGFIMIELTLVPLSAGLHNISGIRLKDTFSSSTYDYDDVAQVFVT